eukprot:TRINITY_DN2089_c0_g1_i1.p1 TRINITY_DN2089_c0_g1~~TRINITY_DN2089_c0_g1_i1.p1  ORF type:complete len:696 (-),score=181.51 TRINITY_DN2089_c0_g1_i1:23-2110(-)
MDYFGRPLSAPRPGDSPDRHLPPTMGGYKTSNNKRKNPFEGGHDMRTKSSTFLNRPSKPGRKPCRYFKTIMGCQIGFACTFLHADQYGEDIRNPKRPRLEDREREMRERERERERERQREKEKEKDRARSKAKSKDRASSHHRELEGHKAKGDRELHQRRYSDAGVLENIVNSNNTNKQAGEGEGDVRHDALRTLSGQTSPEALGIIPETEPLSPPIHPTGTPLSSPPPSLVHSVVTNLAPTQQVPPLAPSAEVLAATPITALLPVQLPQALLPTNLRDKFVAIHAQLTTITIKSKIDRERLDELQRKNDDLDKKLQESNRRNAELMDALDERKREESAMRRETERRLEDKQKEVENGRDRIQTLEKQARHLKDLVDRGNAAAMAHAKAQHHQPVATSQQVLEKKVQELQAMLAAATGGGAVGSGGGVGQQSSKGGADSSAELLRLVEQVAKLQSTNESLESRLTEVSKRSEVLEISLAAAHAAANTPSSLKQQLELMAKRINTAEQRNVKLRRKRDKWAVWRRNSAGRRSEERVNIRLRVLEMKMANLTSATTNSTNNSNNNNNSNTTTTSSTTTTTTATNNNSNNNSTANSQNNINTKDNSNAADYQQLKGRSPTATTTTTTPNTLQPQLQPPQQQQTMKPQQLLQHPTQQQQGKPNSASVVLVSEDEMSEDEEEGNSAPDDDDDDDVTDGDV